MFERLQRVFLVQPKLQVISNRLDLELIEESAIPKDLTGLITALDDLIKAVNMHSANMKIAIAVCNFPSPHRSIEFNRSELLADKSSIHSREKMRSY
jgi:tartrate dehydratase alpha subunit/fumarate hydratase class I-like protein